MQLFGQDMDYRQLQVYVGNMSQVAGIKPYAYTDGKAAGVRAFEVKTGSGLCFDVITDRCLDICHFEYKGIPFAHIAKTGIAAPWTYEPLDEGWARGFNAGLLTTCGFTNAGMACDVGRRHYGMHGRASYIPAQEVNASTVITGGDAEFVISGTVREALLEQECISLHRTIRARMGGTGVCIEDVYTNEGFLPEPLLLIYHCNFGYPMVSPHSRFIAGISDTDVFEARFPDTKNAMDEIYTMKPPSANAQTHVFFHRLAQQGDVSVTIQNEQLGLGLELSFNTEVLPYFTKANIFKCSDYYVVLEPSNCYPLGRLEQEKQYGLEILEPGQQKTVALRFDIME